MPGQLWITLPDNNIEMRDNMASDLFTVFQWYFYLFVIGAIFLPIALKIFKGFYDKGYLFSKTIGIAISTYVVWLLSIFKAAAFSRGAIAFVMFTAALLMYGNKHIRENVKETLCHKWKIFLAEEALFLLIFVFWCYIKGFQPEIYGLEKYMDYGFIQSILRSDYLPAEDMWFSGNGINYYYFGHFIAAFIIRLTAIDSSIGYNLMLATIVGFTFSLTFSLASNVLFSLRKVDKKAIIAAGIISALLVTFGGNLHTFIYAKALPYAQSIGLYKGEVKKYFYSNSTRYIGYNPETNDKTISEFPSYGFVVSDLHAHVSDMYFVITVLALLFALIRNRGEDNAGSIRKTVPILGFFAAIHYMTNSWDYPIYITVSLFVIFYKYYGQMEEGFKGALLKTLIKALEIVLISQLLLLPFTLNFENMAGGIGIVKAHSPLYQLLVLWGYQLILCICLLAVTIMLYRKKKKALPEEDSKGISGIPGYMKTIAFEDAYMVILFISAFGLIFLPEVIYVKDIYGITYHRANTMFKFTYQSFIMMGVASGYVVVRLISTVTRAYGRVFASVAMAIVIGLPMMFPFYAIKGYYGNIFKGTRRGLDGEKFLENRYPDDYYAVKWLKDNVKGTPVVLEAAGDAYSDYERISALTGLPTVVGWGGHEWLWRGGYDKVGLRVEDVRIIYESDDIDETLRLIRKYDVSYIVIGSLEYEKYENINAWKFDSIGQRVFTSLETTIIKVD